MSLKLEPVLTITLKLEDAVPIRDDCKIPLSVRIHDAELVNLYGCTIGEDTKIGAFVEIGRGVHVGERCSIGAYTFIPSGVFIGDDVFIGPRVTFTNDKYPPSPKPFHPLVTIVQDNATICAGAIILPSCTIGVRGFVPAGAIVTKPVPNYKRAPMLYAT